MIGRKISHYEIVEQLGEGGMGVVYKARDARLDRFVALKILPPESVADPDRKRRFIQEAKAASALSHPGIITIHDIAQDGDVDFIVMEFVSGTTLDHVVAERALPTGKALRYAVDIADALTSAHAAGIVHRDLKPANIMITADDRIKVLDFGLAKLTEVTDSSFHGLITQQTEIGAILGTVYYMSPEQAEGRKLDQRSDIFSFGLILYEMITGRRAFSKTTSVATLAAILYSEPTPPGEIVSSLSPELELAIAKCIKKAPADRFQHMPEVRQTLEGIRAGGKSTSRAEKTIHSIAVLPFANLSAEKDNEYFSDGLTEEIITALAKVPGLRVTARTSAFALRGKTDDVREIGEKLKVDSILEGSVRRSANRLRITAQLVNVADGYHVWSERYDRMLEDIFAVQDEITEAIVSALKKELVGSNTVPIGDAPAPRRHTINLSAHESYLKGRFHWNRRTFESLRRGIDYFNDSVAKDHRFALAYVGLSDSYNLLGYYNERPPHDAYPKAKEAASKALGLDNSIAEAHASLGYTALFYDWNWKAADRHFRTAIELNPNYASAHQWHAWYHFAVNRLESAATAMRLAHQLDPLSPIITCHLALGLSYVGRHEEAVEHLQNMLELTPDFPLAYFALGGIHWRAGWKEAALDDFRKTVALSDGRFGLGRLGHACASLGLFEEANQTLKRLQDRQATACVSPLDVALIYAGLLAPDETFKWLERAYEERTSDLIRLRLHPWPSKIRSDPRFEDLARRMGLT